MKRGGWLAVRFDVAAIAEMLFVLGITIALW